jgi:hypothetical protein
MRDDPELAEVDWRVESDKDGNLIVSPAPTRRHRHRQSRILTLLTRLLPAGVALAEYSVSTPEGVKGRTSFGFPTSGPSRPRTTSWMSAHPSSASR